MSVSCQYTQFLAKRTQFFEKGESKWWETDKLKTFLENRQSEYFCLAYFSKLNRDQIEKKLWHFEDNPVSEEGNLTINPQKVT